MWRPTAYMGERRAGAGWKVFVEVFRWMAVLVLVLACATGCTEEGRYHWDRVPYCAAGDGPSGGSFRAHLRVISKHDDGGSIQTLHGMRPLGDVLSRSEVLVAIVACDSPELLPEVRRNAMEVVGQMTPSTVPLICASQRRVVPPVRVLAGPTDAKGFDGSLAFPEVPSEWLACSRGAVMLGSGAR